MKKNTLIRLIFLLLLICMILDACASAPGDTCEKVVRELTAEEYQGRLVGTEGNEKAAAYIADAYSEIGLTPWEGDSYYQEYTQRTIDPDEQRPSVVVHFQDGTEETLVNGKDYLVTEVAEDFTASLPFVTRAGDQKEESIHVSDDTVKAVQSGYDVCFVARDEYRATTRLPESDDPLMIYVTPEVYDRIKLQGKSADIEVHATVRESTAANVAGVIKGKDSSRAIIITAHFDHMGWQGDTFFPGALDNASGIATLLAAAGQVKALLGDGQPEVDLIFVASNSEELLDCGHGMHCIGSTEFVKVLSPKYDAIYNINIDCVGGKEGGPLAMGTSDPASQPLAEIVKQWMADAGIAANDDDYGMGDHMSFRNAGIPAIVLGQYPETIAPYAHVSTDTADTLDYHEIGQISTALAEFLVQKGEGIFSLLENKSVQDADAFEKELAEQQAWQEAGQRELKRLLGDRVLAYNERYYFEMDGYVYEATGWRPFTGLDDLHTYFPTSSIPETLAGYTLDNMYVRTTYIFDDLKRHEKRNAGFATLSQIETVELDSSMIWDVSAVYRSGEDYLELWLAKNLEDLEVEELPLDSPYTGYTLQRNEGYDEEIYEKAVYVLGEWEMYLRLFHEVTFTREGENITARQYFAATDDWLSLLDAFMAETSPEKIVAGLGLE